MRLACPGWRRLVGETIIVIEPLLVRETHVLSAFHILRTPLASIAISVIALWKSGAMT
jgi:hypothetical protein